mmetsp:Transcript_36711/g.32921  ORF Transcript_36711/g.32921 Transcript_36711/m.32921 type:complete len:154 (+) Transcript_36711:908-1369(+)
MLIALIIIIIQQYSGLNILRYNLDNLSKISMRYASAGDDSNLPLYELFASLIAFAFSIGSAVMLKLFGRKPLLTVGTALLGVCWSCFLGLSAIIVGTFSIEEYIFVIFLAIYAFTVGPASWVYLSETLTDIGLSVVIEFGWIITTSTGLWINI